MPLHIHNFSLMFLTLTWRRSDGGHVLPLDRLRLPAGVENGWPVTDPSLLTVPCSSYNRQPTRLRSWRCSLVGSASCLGGKKRTLVTDSVLSDSFPFHLEQTTPPLSLLLSPSRRNIRYLLRVFAVYLIRALIQNTLTLPCLFVTHDRLGIGSTPPPRTSLPDLSRTNITAY